MRYGTVSPTVGARTDLLRRRLANVNKVVLKHKAQGHGRGDIEEGRGNALTLGEKANRDGADEVARSYSDLVDGRALTATGVVSHAVVRAGEEGRAGESTNDHEGRRHHGETCRVAEHPKGHCCRNLEAGDKAKAMVPSVGASHNAKNDSSHGGQQEGNDRVNAGGVFSEVDRGIGFPEEAEFPIIYQIVYALGEDEAGDPHQGPGDAIGNP